MRCCKIIVTVLVCIFHQVFSASVSASSSPDWPRVCPDIVYRDGWGGRIPVAVDYAITPVKFVIVHHTVTPECDSRTSCSNIVRSIQNFHIDTLDFHDVGYNFLVGGDGKVYEGAGWHKVGAHTRGYNSRSLGLAFVGDYSSKRPSEPQLKAAKDFLQCALELGELDSDYKLFGARQVSATLSPGTLLYRQIQNWPHFTKMP